MSEAAAPGLEARLAEAADLSHMGRFKLALELYGEIAREHPESSAVLGRLALAQLRANRPRAALASAEAGLRLDPADELAQRVRARALLRLGRTAAAASAAASGLAACPDAAVLHAESAVAQLAAGDLEGARRAARRGEELAPRDRETGRAAALVALAGGDLGAAERRYRAMLRGDGHDLVAANNLGVTLAAQGRSAEAAPFLRVALGLSEVTDQHPLVRGNHDALLGTGERLRRSLPGGASLLLAALAFFLLIAVVQAPTLVAALLGVGLVGAGLRLGLRRVRGGGALVALPLEAGVRLRRPRRRRR